MARSKSKAKANKKDANKQPKGDSNASKGGVSKSVLVGVLAVVVAAVWLALSNNVIENNHKSKKSINHLQGSSSIILNAVSNTNESEAVKTSKLLAWFESAGGEAHGITVASFDSMGRGVKATDNINADETILVVPLSLVICHKTILEWAGSDEASTVLNLPNANIVKQFKSVLAKSNADAVATFLILQRALGEKSFWNSYLDALPLQVSNALSFTASDLNLLQVSGVTNVYVQ